MRFTSFRTLLLVVVVMPAAVTAVYAQTPPVWEPSFGASLSISGSDDSTTYTTFGTFSFPLYGTVYTGGDELWISTNGFLSIGGDNGDDCCNGDAAQLVNDTFPRIALYWGDLDPGDAGDVFLNTFNDDADPDIDRVVVTFDCTYNDDNNAWLTAQVQLLENGTIIMGFAGIDVQSIDEFHLIGVSPGNGVSDPGSIDLTAAMPFDSGAEPTIYEIWDTPPEPDVDGINVIFYPNQSGGFLVTGELQAPVPAVPPRGIMLLAGLLICVAVVVLRRGWSRF